jgi:hypothetical protein
MFSSRRAPHLLHVIFKRRLLPMLLKPFLRLTLASVLFLAASVVTVSADQNQSPQATVVGDKATYSQLVERAKKGDLSFDFVQLRDAFAVWFRDPKNKDKTEAPKRGEMVEAFQKKDYAKAVELAEVVFDYEFANRGLHLAAEEAHRKLGNAAKAEFHREVAQKLFKALLSAGDGKSAETAFRVFSIREEYIIMEELGYAVSSQSLLSTPNGKSYDMLSGTDKKTGKTVDVFFDISFFFGVH